MITNEAPDWTTEDVTNFRTFLSTRTGERLLPRLANEVPFLLGGGNVNEILIRSGEVRGFQQAIKELLILAFPPPEPPKPTVTYPDLTDDSQWQDGQKINS